MLVNAIHTIDFASESGDVTEPVTLDEVKDYLRLEGFTADDDSGEGAFDFDDALIRCEVNNHRHVYIIEKPVRV